MKIEDTFKQYFSEDLEHLSGTEFESLCYWVMRILEGDNVKHEGHNLYNKPVGYTSDLYANAKVVGQCGTDKNYFNIAKPYEAKKTGKTILPDHPKPIKDIEATMKNSPLCEKLYLLTNRSAQGSDMTNMMEEIEKLNSRPKNVILFDAKIISQIVFDNLSKDICINGILDDLPKCKVFYSMYIKDRQIPLFKSQYYNREEEKEIISKLSSISFLQIWGLSGIGKTELVKSVSQQLKSNFDAVVWINGEDCRNFDANNITISRLDKKINLTTMLNYDHILVVVDNLNSDVKNVVNVFNECNKKKSKLIITSLQRNFSSEESYNLRYLSENVCRKILLNMTVSAPSSKQIPSLIRISQCMPVMIQIMRGYVENGDMTWNELIDDYSKESEIWIDSDYNIPMFQRIIGRFKDTFYKEFYVLAILKTGSICSHFFDAVVGKTKVLDMNKRALLSKDDDKRYVIHDLVLKFIIQLVKKENYKFDLENDIQVYLENYNTKKVSGLFTFFHLHFDFLTNLYQNSTNLILKKHILYGFIQTKNIEVTNDWILKEINKLQLDVSGETIDLQLYIEKNEILLRQAPKDLKEKLRSQIIFELEKININLSPDMQIYYMHHLGKLLIKTDIPNYPRAIQLFEKVIELDKNADYARLQLIDIYKKLHNEDTVEKYVDSVLSDYDINNKSLSVLLAVFQRINQKQFVKLRKKYLMDHFDFFEDLINDSIETFSEECLDTLSSLAGTLAYEKPDYFNKICNKILPPAVDKDTDQKVIFNYAWLKTAQLNYSISGKDEKDKAIDVASYYWQLFDFSKAANYRWKRYSDFLISAERWAVALDIQLNHQEDSKFKSQALCKIYRGLGYYANSLKFIEEALNEEGLMGAFYYTFMRDKAYTLFSMGQVNVGRKLYEDVLKSTDKESRLYNDINNELKELQNNINCDML